MELEHLSFTADVTSPHASDAAERAPFSAQHLAKLDWLTQLYQAPSSRLVFSSNGRAESLISHTDLTADHLFLALLQMQLIQEMAVLYDDEERTIYNAVQLGVPVCGHPTIVHGGLTSAIIDETFGALLYAMKRRQHIELDKVFTAHLGVDYKKPLPAASALVCTAKVESAEGRKIWLTAQVMDRPDGTVYATSRSLFIKVAAAAAAAQPAAAAENGAAANGNAP